MRLRTASFTPAALQPHKLAVAALLCCSPWAVWAQANPETPAAPPAPLSPDSAPLQLRTSPQLQEQFSPELQSQQPTFVEGDSITGRPDLDTVIEGDAQLRRNGSTVRADRIEYYQPDDLAKARGNVRIQRDGSVFTGTEAQIKVEAFEGYFIEPTYQFSKTAGHGEASRIDFIDDKRMVARNATYTTCTRRPGPSWMPDWVLKAAQVSFNTDTDVGEAENVQLRFKDVPIIALPALSFPLSDARKSGFLPPTLNLDTTNGLEYTQPYYWNIAPNRDATFFPSLLTKRGAALGTEFRYLESNYNGALRYDLMPSDRLRERNRWGFTGNHSGTIHTGLRAVGDVGLNLKFNRVSDDNYWRDFPRASGALTQRLLDTDGTLSWSRGPVSLSARALKWQTLQQSDAIITPPYDRLPQLTARYQRSNWAGVDVLAELDTTRFRSQPALTLQPNARRSYALAQVSRPWLAPGYFITPKLQLHATNYQFDSPLVNGVRNAKRLVPTLSVDSGLVFDRQTRFFGRDIVQTLEPRAFYTYTPFRDQSALPNYDSGTTDFNFATIYSDNSFVGNDRFASNNLLTVGVSSRFLDPGTGAEALRLSYAQRLRFRDQNVTLPGGTPDTARFSDMLFGASVNWSPAWSTEAVAQYNPKTQLSERSTLSTRYSPGNYRVVSAAYRFTREASEQVDVGWQWPLNDLWGDKGVDLGAGAGQGEGRWYSVGRVNYSVKDRKIVDTVVGFEYDAGCWLGRIVFDRIQTTTTSAKKGVSFQLEFVGFTRLGVGTNPLRTLKDNVPRYQYLRDRSSSSNPSRFSNYE
jgi:LPS-assembly protein